MTRRRATPRKPRSALAVVGLIVLASAGLAMAPRLLGVGPTKVHDPSVLAATITVCGRQYRATPAIRTLAEIEDRAAMPPTLVDPAPLAPCPGPDEGGHRPCTREALDTACSTVVHVRIGEDAYAEYELVGGP